VASAAWDHNAIPQDSPQKCRRGDSPFLPILMGRVDPNASFKSYGAMRLYLAEGGH
jgi:hypothetical protein